MNRSYTCACCQNGCGPTIEAHLNGDCVSRSSTHECNFAGYGFRVGLHRDLNLKVTRCFHLRVPCMVLICFANRVERISHMYFLDVLFGGTCYHGCLLFAASALNFQAFSLNAPRGQVVGSYGMEKKIKQHAKTWRLNGPWMRYSRLSTQRWNSTPQPSLHMLLRRVAFVSSFTAYLLSSFIYHNLLKAPQLDYERNSTFLSYNFLLLTSVAVTNLVQFAQSASIRTFICRTKPQTCASPWFVYLLKWNCSLRYTAYIYSRMGLCKERES